MIRTFMTSAFALVLAGFVAAPVLAGPEDKDDKTTQQKLDDIQNTLNSFLLQGKQMGKDLKDLQRDHEDFKGKTVDEITKLNNKIDELQKKLDRVSSAGPRIAGTIDPSAGRINVRNTWDGPVTVNVNGRSYVIQPLQDQAIDVPAGSVTYEVFAPGWGIIRPMTTVNVAGGQALLMNVYPILR